MNTFLISVVISILVYLGVGWYAGRKVKSLDDYYTAALNKISEENISINYIDTNKSPWVEIDFEEDYNNLLKRDINEFYN